MAARRLGLLNGPGRAEPGPCRAGKGTGNAEHGLVELSMGYVEPGMAYVGSTPMLGVQKVDTLAITSKRINLDV